MALEEGTQAQWLHDLLKPVVDRVVVCDRRGRVNVSHLLGGEYIGLEEVADDVWAVHFGPVALGWLHTTKLAILDHDGFSSRNPKR